MDHPMVREIESTGYPSGYQERKHYCNDALGNEVYVGDEIFVMNDEVFLIDVLSNETEEALELVGAEIKVAGNE